jgi:RHS repeat-associated protein
LGTTVASYAYDGLGRRIQQTEGGTTTDIYFDANWRDVEEQVSGATQARYVWSSIDQDALVLRDDTPSGGVLTRRIWVQQDANWNVTSIANTSGSVVERYVYDPYSAVTYLTASWGSLSASAYAMQYLFQVGRLDAQSGLYIFEHRDYSATLGRWTEVDPLRYKARDNNLYRFVQNQPITSRDSSGKSPTQPPWPPLRANALNLLCVSGAEQDFFEKVRVQCSGFAFSSNAFFGWISPEHA